MNKNHKGSVCPGLFWNKPVKNEPMYQCNAILRACSLITGYYLEQTKTFSFGLVCIFVSAHEKVNWQIRILSIFFKCHLKLNRGHSGTKESRECRNAFQILCFFRLTFPQTNGVWPYLSPLDGCQHVRQGGISGYYTKNSLYARL